jgi:hypothetical protein
MSKIGSGNVAGTEITSEITAKSCNSLIVIAT